MCSQLAEDLYCIVKHEKPVDRSSRRFLLELSKMFSLQSRISFAILLLPLIDSVIAVYPEKWCLSAEAKSKLSLSHGL